MNGFLESLMAAKKRGRIPVITDFKAISPKSGELFRNRDPIAFARELANVNAPAISVVTEREHFGGSIELLQEIHKNIDLPILRKDFIKSREDLLQTSNSGAAAVLLICSSLTPEKLKILFFESLELGLEPLIEVHNKRELELAISLKPKMIGINNRDITELEKDDGTILTTVELAAEIPEDIFVISESGIMRLNDRQMALLSGADAILVGTAIWNSKDPLGFYLSLSGEEVN